MPAPRPPQPLRSLLLVPAYLQEMPEQVHASAADALLLDLAPGLPGPEAGRAAPTLAAREAATRSLRPLAAAGQRAWVRVHPVASRLAEADLEAVAGQELSGVYLSPVEAPQDVRDVDVMLRRLELERGLRPGSVGLICSIGSARGITHAAEILAASRRVTAAAFGPDDFAADMGVARTRAGEELRYARSALAVAARAAGLDAVDGPYPFVSDPEGFLVEAADARTAGYRGKVCLTATQVATANAVFRPTAEEVATARSILDAHQATLGGGKSPAARAGPGGDPAVTRARTLLALVAAIQERERGRGATP